MLSDEASRVGDKLYRAMRPTLAVGNGDLWLMSTPNGKRGFFWTEWTGGGEQWQRISATAVECSWIDPQFLDDERKEVDVRVRREGGEGDFAGGDGWGFSGVWVDAEFQDFGPMQT